MTDALVLENVTARNLGADLIGASLRHEHGVLAIVGAAADGAGVLLALASGAARPSRGRVLVLGGAPDAMLPKIGFVPLAPVLPEALRVRELVDLAAGLRGDSVSRTAERLLAFGLDGLAARDTRTLSVFEARAVLACEALTSERTELVLIEEPLARMTSAATAAIPRAVRDAKASVVLATASPNDARALAERFAILRKGRLLAVHGPLDAIGLVGAHGARLIADVADAHALAAALFMPESDRTMRIGIEPNRVMLEGPNPEVVARTLQRAIVASGARVECVRAEPLALEPLQIAATAQATALYEAALSRARVVAAIPMPGPVPIEDAKP